MSGVVIYITNIYYKPLPPFWHTFRQELLVARVLLDMEPSQLLPSPTRTLLQLCQTLFDGHQLLVSGCAGHSPPLVLLSHQPGLYHLLLQLPQGGDSLLQLLPFCLYRVEAGWEGPAPLLPPHTAHLQVEGGEGSVQLSDPGLG